MYNTIIGKVLGEFMICGYSCKNDRVVYQVKCLRCNHIMDITLDNRCVINMRCRECSNEYVLIPTVIDNNTGVVKEYKAIKRSLYRKLLSEQPDSVNSDVEMLVYIKKRLDIR